MKSYLVFIIYVINLININSSQFKSHSGEPEFDQTELINKDSLLKHGINKDWH